MSEVTTPTGLPADVWTNIQRDGQTITAYLAEGGEQFRGPSAGAWSQLPRGEDPTTTAWICPRWPGRWTTTGSLRPSTSPATRSR